MSVRKELVGRFQSGEKVSDLLARLDGSEVLGGKLALSVDYRTRPYLDHAVAGWVDGPPASNVAVVFSGADPAVPKWRRFSLTRTGPWSYEIDVFPTPFNNAESPLSPGIPPSASKSAG